MVRVGSQWGLGAGVAQACPGCVALGRSPKLSGPQSSHWILFLSRQNKNVCYVWHSNGTNKERNFFWKEMDISGRRHESHYGKNQSSIGLSYEDFTNFFSSIDGG